MKIRIYQICLARDKRRVAFHGLDFFGSVIDCSIYDCVFAGEVSCIDLEDVYLRFNLGIPDGYIGRSLSISDVVEVIESEKIPTGFYFCDSFGFIPIKSFYERSY